jgi:Oxidoreductase-like protein, N-terminal
MGKLIYCLDCCMSSCAICVYDLYAAALEECQDAMVTAREQLAAKDIPKSKWPIEILSKEDQASRRDEGRRGGVEIGRSLGLTGESEKDKQMAVVIGAFVEFEKTLREKKKREREKGKEGN